MLKELLYEQQSYLNHYFEKLDLLQVEKAVEQCLQTRGLLILTGIGKSGIIAEKIAMTLVSTGSRALFLPAINFLHGDIGIVSEQDTVLLFSKSGETEELLTLQPFIKKRGAKTVAIVSNEQSRLAERSDLHVSLPVMKELCPFDLAPTTSTEVQLLFGDLLAILLMKKKGFALSSYGANHPSGSIGKKIHLKVDDVMITGAAMPVCRSTDLLKHVLAELTDKKCGCLVVVDENKQLQGIFTDGDLRRALQSIGSEVIERSLQDVMTRKASTVQKGQLAWDAMKLMQKDPGKWIMVLPVVDDQKVVGLLRLHDIIHSGL